VWIVDASCVRSQYILTRLNAFPLRSSGTLVNSRCMQTTLLVECTRRFWIGSANSAASSWYRQACVRFRETVHAYALVRIVVKGCRQWGRRDHRLLAAAQGCRSAHDTQRTAMPRNLSCHLQASPSSYKQLLAMCTRRVQLSLSGPRVGRKRWLAAVPKGMATYTCIHCIVRTYILMLL
jgi:hypothetical protein